MKKLINYIKKLIGGEPQVEETKETDFQMKVKLSHSRDKYLILYSNTVNQNGLRKWNLIREMYYKKFGSSPFYINASRRSIKQAKVFAKTFKSIEDIIAHNKNQKLSETKYIQRLRKYRDEQIQEEIIK